MPLSVSPEELGRTAGSVRAPGGTRKVGYLSGTPSSILENLPNIMAALHARIKWVQMGHSAQTLSHLMELGNSLASVPFVVFCIVFTDLLACGLRPFTLLVQGVLDPSAFARAERRMMLYFEKAAVAIVQLRTLCRVIALLRQHASERDLRSMLEAHSLSKMGRCFPTFFKAAPNIILQGVPSYNGTDLRVLSNHDSSKSVCYGPVCQCSGQENHHRQQWDKSVGREGVNFETFEQSVVTIRRRHGCQEVRVPHYVAHPQSGPSGFSRLPACACVDKGPPCIGVCNGLLSVEPRFQLRTRGKLAPPHFVVRGKFRTTWTSTNASICRVQHRAYVVHKEVDTALRSASALVGHLRKELSDVMGDVGMNSSMAKLLKNASVCWDWAHLVSHPPTAAHTKAYAEVCRDLEPCMRKTLYPEAEVFSSVKKQWPSVHALGGQYIWLLRRVRTAMDAGRLVRGGLPPADLIGGLRPSEPLGLVRHHGRVHRVQVPRDVCEASARWIDADLYEVRPLWAHGFVFGCVRGQLREQSRAVVCKLACWVSLFLGGLPLDAYTTSVIDAGRLFPPGCPPRRRSSKQPARSNYHWSAGDVAQMRNKKLVRIVRVSVRVQTALVMAAICQHPWFSLGLGCVGSYQCWHAGRVAHRCSSLFPPEAPCERIGSLMRLFWEPRRHIGPVEVEDLVLLAQAGVQCSGSSRDEVLVDLVAGLIEKTSQHKMRQGLFDDGYKQPLVQQDQERVLEASGRFHGNSAGCDTTEFQPASIMALTGQGYATRRQFLQARDKGGKPTTFPKALQGEVGKHIIHGQVQPVQAGVLELHAHQRGATKSVLREKTTAWLESDGGKAWLAERAVLFGSGGAEERVAPVLSSGGGRVAPASSSGAVSSEKQAAGVKRKVMFELPPH